MPHLPVSIRTLVVAALLLGCAEPPPRGTPTTLRTFPHAADRYARLLRQQLTDSNPLDLEQQLTCETVRMERALGSREAVLRIEGVHDSIYAKPEAQAQRQRIRAARAGHSFEFGGPLCDSLNAIADREDPIVKVDTTGARPDSTP
ncbi:MAG: hypothetical protein WBQ26_02910 [Gemmatimonadaceae bacterium]|nr:hypothetical protein [Gemmatimonadaceae bacterium]